MADCSATVLISLVTVLVLKPISRGQNVQNLLLKTILLFCRYSWFFSFNFPGFFKSTSCRISWLFLLIFLAFSSHFSGSFCQFLRFLSANFSGFFVSIFYAKKSIFGGQSVHNPLLKSYFFSVDFPGFFLSIFLVFFVNF